MRFAVKYFLVILSVFICTSCGVKNNPVSSGDSNKQVNNSGFVIDSLKYNIEARKDSDGIYNDYFVYNISYHFNNCEGSLKDLAVVPVGSPSYMMISGSSSPSIANKIISLKSDYSLGKKYNSGDVVKISLSMEGEIMKAVSGSAGTFDEFNVQKNFDVKID